LFKQFELKKFQFHRFHYLLIKFQSEMLSNNQTLKFLLKLYKSRKRTPTLLHDTHLWHDCKSWAGHASSYLSQFWNWNVLCSRHTTRHYERKSSRKTNSNLKFHKKQPVLLFPHFKTFFKYSNPKNLKYRCWITIY